MRTYFPSISSPNWSSEVGIEMDSLSVIDTSSSSAAQGPMYQHKVTYCLNTSLDEHFFLSEGKREGTNSIPHHFILPRPSSYHFSDIPVGSCGDDSYFGLGIMDGGLEECDRWKLETTNPEYEEHKCKVLRVHASVKDGKCTCDENWKGPICNEYNGCGTGETLFGTSCTPHMCHHNGTIAVGKKEIECICPPPWDGRLCERLACWRKTIPTQQHRYRNNGDHCICGNHYSGENCDIVKSCLNNGQLVDGKCKCGDGWHGELCDKRCPKGHVTCSTCSSFISASLLTIVLLVVNKFNH